MDLGQTVAGISWVGRGRTPRHRSTRSPSRSFSILENRSPQSTFAWLFLLILVPLGGIAIYALFGRGRHAFSRARVLRSLVEGSTLAGRSAALLDAQPAKLAALAERHGEYARIATMLWATARSPLTFGNEVEVLQDASEKYPRLLEDIRAATGCIHLLYYEWASDSFTEEIADLLAEKVKQGVTVRILYDPIGSFSMLSWSYLRSIRRRGVRMHRSPAGISSTPSATATIARSR